MSRTRELAAADELERLIPELQQVVTDLRRGREMPYSRVYWFRAKVSRVVATLGSGQPRKVIEA